MRRASIATLALRLCAAAMVLGLLSATPQAHAAPPIPHWRTLETDHFRIHFYDEERALAYRGAYIAERAWLMLTRYFNWVPAGLVDITITDQTDSANGFANSIPYNYVFGFGAPPDSLSSLNDFDDWLTVLLTHEITHVVHLDITLGLSRLVNFILGKTVAPNQVQPNWFIEGIAVVEESAGGTGGRIRNNLFDMFLRMPVLEDRFHGIDAVSNGPRAFPQGNAAYLYGSSFVKYLEDRFGPDKIRELSHRYGSRLLPFGLNRAAREAFGDGFDELWLQWKDALRRDYTIQADEARRKGLSPVQRLTFDGEGAGGGPTPRYLHDGSGVVFQDANSWRRAAYRRIDPVTGASALIREINGAGTASPTPDDRGLVIQQSTFQSMKNRIAGSSHADWDDLYRLDLPTGEMVRLTHAARAHEPDVSPDGKWIAAAVGAVGQIDLGIVPIEGGTPRIVAHHEDDIVYTPAWSPDGTRIAYSRWKEGGFRDIHVYDVRDGTDRALWTDRAMDMDPRWLPDGKRLIFSSDRTGIYNLFVYELDTDRLWQVTNVIGGAFQPTVSPDASRVVFTGFSAAGYDLYTAPLEPERWMLAGPYVNDRDDAEPAGGATDPDDVKDAARRARLGQPPAPPPEPLRPETFIRGVRDYQPWRHMYPRAWNIVLSSNPLGLGADIGIDTTVGNPVGNHTLAFRTDIPMDGDASARADYTYSGIWPSLSLSVSRAAYETGGLIMDAGNYSYREHALTLGASTSLPVLRKMDAWADLWGGYNWRNYWPADGIMPADPRNGITQLPEKGPDAGVYMGFFYSNVQSWNYATSGQEGRRLSASVSVNDPAFGGRFRTVEAGWSWTEFLTMPWAKLQALGLTYSGGVGIGDKRAFFGLGGFAEQDLIRSFFLNIRQCCGFLRGYKPGSIGGDQFHLGSAEYRLPLLWIEKSYRTFPVYLRRLNGAAFTDVGNAFYGDFHPSELRVGVGGELRLEFRVGYYIESLLQIGVAKGLSKDGITDYYLASSFPF